MFIFTSRADKNIPLNSTIKSARASQNNYILPLRPDVPISQWSRVSKFSGNSILWVSCLSLYFDSYNVEQCVTDCYSRLPEIYCTHNILKWHRPRRALRLKLEKCMLARIVHSLVQFSGPNFFVLLFFCIRRSAKEWTIVQKFYSQI